jgi:hypothetical protein
MDIYKITISKNYKKSFYESKETFEKNWKVHKARYAKHYPVIAYQIDWENKCWKEIGRMGPLKIN